MQLLAGANPRVPHYADTRRHSLNFESCGGERYSHDDLELRPSAKILRFPVRVARRVVSLNHRKEAPMSPKPTPPTEPNEKSVTDTIRYETFSPTGPVEAYVSTKSGDVVVRTVAGDRLEITLKGSPKHPQLLGAADITFDAATNQLHVRTHVEFVGTVRDLAQVVKHSWFDFGSSDLDVTVVLPEGSSLEVKTASGDTSVEGLLDEVDVSSASGDVDVKADATRLDVKSASGDIDAGHVQEYLRCRSASGDVRCAGAAERTEIKTASGDVALFVERAGEVSVQAVSGDVRVRVARGLAVDINGNTVTGDLGSNIDLGSSLDGESSDEVIIKVTTVSGDVRIDKAS